MTAPLGHRGSEDFADMLEQAVSTLHDDDLLLGGSGGGTELTIEHIHNLSSELACKLWDTQHKALLRVRCWALGVKALPPSPHCRRCCRCRPAAFDG